MSIETTPTPAESAYLAAGQKALGSFEQILQGRRLSSYDVSISPLEVIEDGIRQLQGFIAERERYIQRDTKNIADNKRDLVEMRRQLALYETARSALFKDSNVALAKGIPAGSAGYCAGYEFQAVQNQQASGKPRGKKLRVTQADIAYQTQKELEVAARQAAMPVTNFHVSKDPVTGKDVVTDIHGNV